MRVHPVLAARERQRRAAVPVRPAARPVAWPMRVLRPVPTRQSVRQSAGQRAALPRRRTPAVRDRARVRRPRHGRSPHEEPTAQPPSHPHDRTPEQTQERAPKQTPKQTSERSPEQTWTNAPPSPAAPAAAPRARPEPRSAWRTAPAAARTASRGARPAWPPAGLMRRHRPGRTGSLCCSLSALWLPGPGRSGCRRWLRGR